MNDPNRPVNVPPPDLGVQPPEEGWSRFWVPFTVALIVALGAAMWTVVGWGTPWAECQIRYEAATTAADSAAIDVLRLGGGERPCGAMRLDRLGP